MEKVIDAPAGRARGGAPIAHADDPERAVRAALDLIDIVRSRRPGIAGGGADLGQRRVQQRDHLGRGERLVERHAEVPEAAQAVTAPR